MVLETEQQPSQKEPFETYLKNRIDHILSKVGSGRWTRRRFTFFENKGQDDQKTSTLPDFKVPIELVYRPASNVTYDPEGKVFHAEWVKRKKIGSGAKIFGPLQKGRDYYQKPPKKEIREYKKYYIAAGVDVALRRAEEIKGKYRVEDKEENSGEEAKQMLATLQFLEELQKKVASISQCSQEELDDLKSKIDQFLNTNNFDHVRQTDKIKIREMLQSGFLDSRKRKNYLTAMYKIFSCTLSARKRLEYDCPAILCQYTVDFECLRMARVASRQNMQKAINQLEIILESPLFSDGAIYQKTKEEQLEEARGIYKELLSVSRYLIKSVPMRPYVLGARKAIENFGNIILPEKIDPKTGTKIKTISRIVQERRQKRGVPTVRDYLGQGDFDNAKALLEQSRSMLQKILDIHVDYQTVKPSGRFKRGVSYEAKEEDLS